MIGYFEVRVLKVSAIEVTFSTTDANQIVITAASAAHKARSKAIFGYTVRASSSAHKARTSASAIFRTYTQRSFDFFPALAPARAMEITYSFAYKLVLTGQSKGHKARSSVEIDIPTVLMGKSAAHKARTHGGLFMPPYQVVGQSSSLKARTSGMVGVPLFVEASALGKKARTSASLQEKRAINARSTAYKGRMLARLALSESLKIDARSVGHKARTAGSLVVASAQRRRRILILSGS